MSYETLKWLHVISAAVLVGGGLGSAFHLLASAMRRDARVVAATAANVLWSDALLTIPAAVFQAVSGWWMVRQAGLTWSAPWLLWSLVLYGASLALWLPVIALEVAQRNIARRAAAEGLPLPRSYWACLGLWAALGLVGFAGFLAALWLMLIKRLPGQLPA